MAKLIKSTSALTACFSLSLLALFAIAFFFSQFICFPFYGWKPHLILSLKPDSYRVHVTTILSVLQGEVNLVSHTFWSLSKLHTHETWSLLPFSLSQPFPTQYHGYFTITILECLFRAYSYDTEQTKTKQLFCNQGHNKSYVWHY